MVDGMSAAHSAPSGLLVIDTGEESLKARLCMIQTARHTLDLQYYAIHDDITSNLLIEAVVKAAERGVRVRLLIDDISIGKARRSLSILDMMHNIEVRIFNPISKTYQSSLARFISFFANFDRATKRMHNKVLIADSETGITGGRNLGDEYFDAHADVAFKDIDIMAIGPVIKDMEQNFEEFWNDKNAHPIGELYKMKKSMQIILQLKHKLRKNLKTEIRSKKKREEFYAACTGYLESADSRLIWANADFIADKPHKIDGEVENASEPIQEILSLIEHAEEEFLIVSPYFVPQAKEMAWLKSLKKQGIKVRIVTNSLASTDVVAVHTGYVRRRMEILENGIELYEMKANDKKPRQRLLGRKTPSNASLHAKVYVVDRKAAVIGSLNFDPRSQNLNTEVALTVYNEDIARQLHDLYEKVTSPESSYRLLLENTDIGPRIVWITHEDGKKSVHSVEPEANLWRRVQVLLMGFLPIENQL